MKYEPHEIAERSPPMPEEQFLELKADIAERGQLFPVVLYEGRILDGRHRDKACRELGIEPDVIAFDGTREEAEAYAVSANDKRRHLTAVARREWVKQLRARGLSTRAIAEQVGASHETVRNDIKAGVKFLTPEPDPEPEPCATSPTPSAPSAKPSTARRVRVRTTEPRQSIRPLAQLFVRAPRP